MVERIGRKANEIEGVVGVVESSSTTIVVLPKALFEKLKRLSESQGMTVEELIMDRFLEDIDPGRRAEMYWDMSEEYLRRAKEDFGRGDLKQASEKIWGAAALGVKAVAYMRSGNRLKSHGELWEYVNKLVIETSDEELGRLWRTAISMHVNFYENWAPREEVERSLKDVEKFLEKLKKLCGK